MDNGRADPSSPSGSSSRVNPASTRSTTNLVTLVFTDVVGSTSLKQTEGDRAAAVMLEQHDELVRQTLAEFPRGQEIGTAGDSFFCAFTVPSEAVRFALTLQNRLRSFNAERKIQILDRVGIHLGEVVVKTPEAKLQSKHLYGLSLDTCARVMGLADGGRILMTNTVFDSARSMMRGEEIAGLGEIVWRNHGKYQFKGIEEPTEVFEVAEVGMSPLTPPESQEKALRVEEGQPSPQFTWPPKPGTKLGERYVVEELIGSGGMGSVLRGIDIRLNRAVALKFIPAELANSRERIERIKLEARALAALSHPNVVTVYSVEEVSGRHYIVMELVEGKTLSRLIPSEGMELQQFFAIAIPLVEALSAAHARGIIHRDLKPANVMVTDRNRVKVIDFGLAKVIPTPEERISAASPSSPLSTEHVLLGTPAYMSPEQAQGLPLDQRSDIFSLGVIFYEMLTGRKPFQGDSHASIVSAVLRDKPELVTKGRNSVPEALAELVNACLEKDIQHRFQSVDTVLEKLQGIQARSHLPSETGIGLPPLSAPPAKRSRKLLLSIAAIGSVLGLWFLAVNLKEDPLGPVGLTSSNSVSLRIRPRAGSTRVRFISPKPVLATSATEEWPAISPEGGRMAFVRRVNGFLQVFVRDRNAEGSELQLTDDERDHMQPAWSANGKMLAFCGGRDAEKGIIRASDVWGGWYHPADSDIWLFDFATSKSTRILEESVNPKFSHDNQLAFVKNLDGGGTSIRIWTSDLKGLSRKPLSEDVEGVIHVEPSWSPDGRKIVFRRQSSKYMANISVLDLETRKITDLTPEIFASDPVWSPTGKHIYFTANLSSGFNLWRLPVNGEGKVKGEMEPMTFGTGRDLHPTLSPDGKSLFYTILSWNSDLWALPIDPSSGKASGEPFELIASPLEDTRGDWSSDSRRIVFTSDRNGDMNLFVAEFDPAARKVGAIRQLTFGPGGDYQPTWSPDQSRIAFFSRRSGKEQIWRLDLSPDGKPVGPVVQLTKEGKNINPSFSPDGSQIAFLSDRTGLSQLWTMNPEGNGQRVLSSGAAFGHYVRWMDTNTVLYSNGSVKGAHLDDKPEAQFIKRGGAHLTLSPGGKFLADNDHRKIFVWRFDNGDPQTTYEFSDKNVGVDYTVWSPDGKWILFDRNSPQGGDIYELHGVE